MTRQSGSADDVTRTMPPELGFTGSKRGANSERLSASVYLATGGGSQLAQTQLVEEGDNPRWRMDRERAAFVDLVRWCIDPDGLFRRGVLPQALPNR